MVFELVEAAVSRTLERSRDGLRAQLAEANAEILRIHNEKVDHFEARIKAERELAEARRDAARWTPKDDKWNSAL